MAEKKTVSESLATECNSALKREQFKIKSGDRIRKKGKKEKKEKWRNQTPGTTRW